MEGAHVRYATTPDGSDIAFTVVGSGAPLVVLGGMLNSVRLDLRVSEPSEAAFYDALAARHSIVLLDWRGAGLSGPADKFDLESYVTDVECVLEALRLEQVDLYAVVAPCHVALRLAAERPGLVRRLVLTRPPGRSGAATTGLGFDPMATDFESYLRAWAIRVHGWTDAAREFFEQMSKRWTADAFRAYWASVGSLDGSGFAESVACETLVVALEDDAEPLRRAARQLAAALPHGRLLISRARQLSEDHARIVNDFLGDWDAPLEVPAAPDPLPEGAVVILFTDIVESTALTERLGDAAFRARARDLDASLRTLVRENAGTPVEGTLLGDGLLAVFTSARQAIDCALKCNAAAEGAGLQLHLGLHAGDVLREGNNVYGGAVNIAARIMGLTAPGQVLVSDTVRSLARTSAGVTFADQGEHALKGIADPVRVFEVRGQT
jgi:class 3 adenylate cyclase